MQLERLVEYIIFIDYGIKCTHMVYNQSYVSPQLEINIKHIDNYTERPSMYAYHYIAYHFVCLDYHCTFGTKLLTLNVTHAV